MGRKVGNYYESDPSELGRNLDSHPKSFNFAKLAIFIFTVFLPAVAVGISNWYVFRDSFVIATILLIITVGVAAVATYYSGAALARIRKYCLMFDLLIGIVLCINLTSHFLLARDVSAAKESVEDRHIEEERKAVFQRNQTEQQQRILDAQAKLLEQQQKALRAEALRNDSAKRLGVKPAPQSSSIIIGPKFEPSAEPTTDPLQANLAAITESRQAEKSLTPEEVKKKWNGWLTFWAFVDVFVAVIGGSILASIWQWDRNDNGISDDEEERLIQQWLEWRSKLPPSNYEEGRIIGLSPKEMPAQPVAQDRRPKAQRH